MAELRAFTVSDKQRWNAFVEGAPYAAFPQLWEWGELREPFGWRPVRLAVGERPDDPIAGAQVLLRPIPGIGWRLGYAPRGPIGAVDDPAVLDALIAALRTLGRRERIATMKVDPAASSSDPLGAALLAVPWRAADRVQPPSSRILDLTRTEDELRADLKKKHRQYVNKAEREGVSVEWLAPDAAPAEVERALADFMRIYAGHGGAGRLRRTRARLLRAGVAAVRAGPSSTACLCDARR